MHVGWMKLDRYIDGDKNSLVVTVMTPFPHVTPAPRLFLVLWDDETGIKRWGWRERVGSKG